MRYNNNQVLHCIIFHLVDLDPFFLNPVAADRGGLNLADYLTALFNRSNVIRPENLVKGLSVMIGTIAMARMGNVTNNKSAKIMDAVRDQNNLDLIIDPKIIWNVFHYVGSHIRECNIHIGNLLSSMASLFLF